MSFSDTPPPPPPPPQPPGGTGGAFTLATWDRRALAFLIDVGIILGGYIAVALVAGLLGLIADALGGLVAVLGYLAVFGFAIWQQIVQGQTGQTIGKKQIGIKLVREQDVQVVGPGMAIVRQIVHIVDAIPCYVGFLWPLWDQKRQTFADKILQTVVIEARP